MSILVVGHALDPHVEKVVGHLRGFGCDVFVFDRYACDSELALFVNQAGMHGCIDDGSSRLNLGAVEAVWWRLKSMRVEEFTGAFNNNSEIFCDREWRTAIHSIPAFCRDAFWVNSLEAQSRANHKPFQLVLAQAHGLKIPDTVFTNSHDDVLELFERHDRLVYKQLSWTMFPPDEVIFTNEVNKKMIHNSERSIRLAPGIFQEYIDKSAELRVAVVGEEIFSVAIDSQKLPKTQIDWRRSQLEDMFISDNLSHDVSEKLLAFHRAANLEFAVYDFIVDLNGEAVFLECNPSGQWLWLEERLGIPIALSLARHLASRG